MNTRLLCSIVLCAMAGSAPAMAWGPRGHNVINQTAVQSLPDQGTGFLKRHEGWIVYLSNIPDSWRRPTEPSLRILEDPNHGWFKEQFHMLDSIPRSRYEFVIALYEEQKKLAKSNPEAAALTNVRWTGTLPYAAQENFERMKAAMRRYRASLSTAGPEREYIEREIASYMGRLGHYTGDGAQPLHDTIHHDGWAGDNPKNYTRERQVHGRFESQYVEIIQPVADDLLPLIGPARHLEDPFTASLAHLDQAASHVEEVYQLDQSGALKDAKHPRARELALERLASGARLLRDLAYTAWLDSAQAEAGLGNPTLATAPGYNPATGSAPPGPPVSNHR
jgi:hypothetical protein